MCLFDFSKIKNTLLLSRKNMKFYLSLFSLFISILAFSQSNYLLVGTYTATTSKGIYVYSFDTSNANTSLLSVAATSNPSFLTVSSNKKYVYAVGENVDSTITPVGGSVTAFSFNNGMLTKINAQPSGGKNPCYVTINKTGKNIFVGNYSSGSLASLTINVDGSLNASNQIITHSGNSINKKRQEAPHVHATVLSPNNKFLYVPDLGIDKVVCYAINKKTGVLTNTSAAESLPGSGPRHFTFAPNDKFAYLMEELTGTVVCYKVNGTNLKFVQRISSHPSDFKGTIGSADIHVSPDNKFLYCSNRGDANSIAIFAVDKNTGTLTNVGFHSTLGKSPRNFNFDPSGNFLLVANQNSDEIVIFKIDKATGLLNDTGKKITVPKPVCLQWIN
jgi:6-phosphogluconolactonase